MKTFLSVLLLVASNSSIAWLSHQVGHSAGWTDGFDCRNLAVQDEVRGLETSVGHFGDAESTTLMSAMVAELTVPLEDLQDAIALLAARQKDLQRRLSYEQERDSSLKDNVVYHTARVVDAVANAGEYDQPVEEEAFTVVTILPDP